MKMKIYLLTSLCLIVNIAFAQQQQNADSTTSLLDLSLEELMNVPIKSASKKEETLFDAPLSSYAITRSDIVNAGATSIPEALRLAPGVIVREQANGVYDVHIRGMDNIALNYSKQFSMNSLSPKSNVTTLLMIDNRPVYSHYVGGSKWEALPIDINDVERIEIVRGPLSALFGPNAVTGVINIITRRMGNAKTMVDANLQAGNLGTTIANISMGRNLTDKLSVIVSANLQDRRRTTTDYFNYDYPASTTGTYGPLSDVDLFSVDSVRLYSYPYQTRALNKWGINGNVTYKFTDDVKVELAVSKQRAEWQRIFDRYPMNYAITDNFVTSLDVVIKSLKISTMYQDVYSADIKALVPSPNGEYDQKSANIIVENDFKLNKKKYTITPGISYQYVTYDPTPYNSPEKGTYAIVPRIHDLTTISAFLRSDLNITQNLRVVAAGRIDKFSIPDKAYLAYEFATTYKINKNNLVRAAMSRSNSSAFIGTIHTDIGDGQTFRYLGDSTFNLYTINMIEFGYRVKLTSTLQIDFDMFQQKAENLLGASYTSLYPIPTIKTGNLSNTATQRGITLSINYVPNDKIQFKPFVTFQRTDLKNVPSEPIDPVYASQISFPLTYKDMRHRHTPTTYGGFYLNYQPIDKLNINFNGYYFAKQAQYDPTWSEADTTTPAYQQAHIKSKFLLSAKISYEVIDGLKVFANARNLFNSKSVEVYTADPTSGLYLLGVSYKLN